MKDESGMFKMTAEGLRHDFEFLKIYFPGVLGFRHQKLTKYDIVFKSLIKK